MLVSFFEDVVIWACVVVNVYKQLDLKWADEAKQCDQIWFLLDCFKELKKLNMKAKVSCCPIPISATIGRFC